MKAIEDEVTEITTYLTDGESKADLLWRKGKKVEACQDLFDTLRLSNLMLETLNPPKANRRAISTLHTTLKNKINNWGTEMTKTEKALAEERHSMFQPSRDCYMREKTSNTSHNCVSRMFKPLYEKTKTNNESQNCASLRKYCCF